MRAMRLLLPTRIFNPERIESFSPGLRVPRRSNAKAGGTPAAQKLSEGGSYPGKRFEWETNPERVEPLRRVFAWVERLGHNPFRGCFQIRPKSYKCRVMCRKIDWVGSITTSYVSKGILLAMASLPQTGTALLLEKLSPFLDDTLINQLVPRQRGPGRRRAFSSAQLFRVLLLSLLTPAHSFNLLLKLLLENRAWRRFARLPNLRLLPDPKMLHQFRSRLDLLILRELNASLVRPLIANLDPSRLPVAIMDSTDLPAAANSFKKTDRILRGALRWGPVLSKAGRVAGSLAIRNTVCDSGLRNVRKRCCWCRSYRGQPRLTGAMCYFWSPACDTSANGWTSRPPSLSRTWRTSTWPRNAGCAKNFTWEL